MVALSTQLSLLQRFGTKLVINPEKSYYFDERRVSIDCETDEKDNFVGLALYYGSDEIYYFSTISTELKVFLGRAKLVGHNLKSDAKWLKKWGVNIEPSQLEHDTMLQSYVMNTTKDSHGLKQLAKEYLNMEWPSYKEMVHPDPEHKTKKVTLDKQPIEKVAEYCSMDCLATYRLYKYFAEEMNATEWTYYKEIEMPLMRVLYEMELKGIKIDKSKLNQREFNYNTAVITLETVLSSQGVNPRSPKQLLEYFRKEGLNIKNTQKETLQWIADNGNEYAKLLLEYKRLFKIHSVYLKPYLGQDRLYTEYNQVRTTEKDDLVGISTGRLSSHTPNLQNIPAHGQDGKNIRELFIPDEDKILVCADYSQIEYRLLAHFTQEPRLLEAFKAGRDVHEETGKLIGSSRDTGKTINFASIYGAKEKKIAKTAKISEQESAKFLETYWKVLPKVTSWINRIKYMAHIQKKVTTLFGRVVPLPLINSSNKYERWHWERAAVNYVIQGSAAEIIKLAMIKLKERNYLPLLSVHDELLFETNHVGDEINRLIINITTTMEEIVKLDVPLTVSIGTGKNWSEAKEK